MHPSAANVAQKSILVWEPLEKWHVGNGAALVWSASLCPLAKR